MPPEVEQPVSDGDGGSRVPGRARGDGVPLDESGGEDVGGGAAGGPMLRTVHERVLRPRHATTAGCRERASALVLWGRPGELPAGGERGAG